MPNRDTKANRTRYVDRPPTHRRLATVLAVDTVDGNSCTLQVMGDTTQHVGASYMGNYRPVVNDVVWCLQVGTDWLVLGPQVPGGRAKMLTNYQAGSSTRTSTAYGDCADGAHPTVTLDVVVGEVLLVLWKARVSADAATTGARMSYAVSGVDTQAASDNDMFESDQTNGESAACFALYTAVATGSITITSKYRIVNAGTGTFLERRLIVVRV